MNCDRRCGRRTSASEKRSQPPLSSIGSIPPAAWPKFAFYVCLRDDRSNVRPTAKGRERIYANSISMPWTCRLNRHARQLTTACAMFDHEESAIAASLPAAQNLRRHSADPGHRVAPQPPWAGASAAAQGHGAPGGAAARKWSSTCLQTHTPQVGATGRQDRLRTLSRAMPGVLSALRSRYHDGS